MQSPLIIHNDESNEYFFEEGCYILEVSNSEKDAGLSVARARLTPNTETRLHRLNKTIERYIIVSGNGVVIIPENCPQMIRNTGDDDLIFLVVCTPRFLPENYYDV
ncbi:hypothetical protein ACVBE9_08385 [Eionea flava]